jgi:hypothetical protein
LTRHFEGKGKVVIVDLKHHKTHYLKGGRRTSLRLGASGDEHLFSISNFSLDSFCKIIWRLVLNAEARRRQLLLNVLHVQQPFDL